MTLPSGIIYFFTTVGVLYCGGLMTTVLQRLQYYFKYKAWPLTQTELELATLQQRYTELQKISQTNETEYSELTKSLIDRLKEI